MTRKNELVSTNSNNSELSLNIPNGRGEFERGIDGRGNPYEKRSYNNGDFLKVEQLRSGEVKVTAKKKI